jgi:hypothetical protein
MSFLSSHFWGRKVYADTLYRVQCTYSTHQQILFYPQHTLPPNYSNVRQLITHRPNLIVLVVVYADLLFDCGVHRVYYTSILTHIQLHPPLTMASFSSLIHTQS